MDAISQMSKKTLAAIAVGVLTLIAVVIAIFGHGDSKTASSPTSPSATSSGAWSDAPRATSSGNPDPFSSSSSTTTTESGENAPRESSDEVTQPTDSHPSYSVPASQSAAATYPTTSPIYKAADTVTDSMLSYSSSDTDASASKRADAMKSYMTDSMWSIANPGGATNNAPWDAAKADATQGKLSANIEDFTARDVGNDMPNTDDTIYLHVSYNLATYQNGTRVSSTPTKKAYVLKKVDGVWKVDQIMDDVN